MKTLNDFLNEKIDCWDWSIAVMKSRIAKLEKIVKCQAEALEFTINQVGEPIRVEQAYRNSTRKINEAQAQVLKIIEGDK